MLFRHTSKPSCLAYLVTCWVELPDEAWHPCANRHKFRRPVCRLVKALYGHPDAGTMWEQHCHTAVEKVGFKPLGDEWPSLYFHPDLKLLLVIYVEDLKMAGPTANLPKGWKMLRQELRLEDETPLGLCLGCRISKGEATLPDKTKVQTVTYDMETYLEMTVNKYCDVTGFDSSKFKTVPSPSPAEETKHHRARAPAQSGNSHRCTWCGHTMPVDALEPAIAGCGGVWTATLTTARGSPPEKAMEDSLHARARRSAALPVRPAASTQNEATACC